MFFLSLFFFLSVCSLLRDARMLARISQYIHLKRYKGFLVCKRQTYESMKERPVHPRELVSVFVWYIVYDELSAMVANLYHFPYLRRAHCGIASDV